MERTTLRKVHAEDDKCRAEMDAEALARGDMELVGAYKQRDNECRRLTEQFFAWIGMGLDEEYTELEDGSFDKEIEELQAEAARIGGWVIWTGEETMKVWRDGVELGKTMFCCRGGLYGAECTVSSKKYKADDETGGQWLEA